MGQNTVVTGMVLKVMPIGDYDKRITLLTKERGKITAFARGARRQGSQLLAATNPFSFGEFELYEGRSSYTVAKASIQNYFRELAADIDATYYGFYFLEFADYYCQENNDEREMLKLLYQTLRALESPAFDNRLVRIVYELKAMAVNGVGPNVFSCVKCGKKEAISSFSVKRGGVLCEACSMVRRAEHATNRSLSRDSDQAAIRTEIQDVIRVEESTVYTMQYVISSTVEKLYTFTVSTKVLQELQQVMREYLHRYLGHSFQSIKILEEMDSLAVEITNLK